MLFSLGLESLIIRCSSLIQNHCIARQCKLRGKDLLRAARVCLSVCFHCLVLKDNIFYKSKFYRLCFRKLIFWQTSTSRATIIFTDSEREKHGEFYEIFFGTIWLGSHFEIFEKPPYVFRGHSEQESYSFSKNWQWIIVVRHFLSTLKIFYDCGTKIELRVSVLLEVYKCSKRPSHVATEEIPLFELELRRNHSSEWGDIHLKKL